MARARASVTQLRGPRRASTRLGPREARELADRARAAGLVGRGTPYRLFLHLLRVVDPRDGFSRQLPHNTPTEQDHLPVNSRTVGLADELGCSLRTLIYAVRALEASGLVRVQPGTGRKWTRYTVDAAAVREHLGELPGSPWENYPVSPGESPANEGCNNDTPEVQIQHPRGAETPPQGCKNEAPNARMRGRARERDPLRPDPLPPGEPVTLGAALADPPAGVGRGPLPGETEQGTACRHGRTPAQGGCRECGTNPRTDATARARAELEQLAEQRRAEQVAQREQRQLERERADPAAYDRGAAQARELLRRRRSEQTSEHQSEQHTEGDSE